MVSDVIWRTIQALVSFKHVIWTCMHAILIIFEKLEIAFETILLYQYTKSIFFCQTYSTPYACITLNQLKDKKNKANRIVNGKENRFAFDTWVQILKTYGNCVNIALFTYRSAFRCLSRKQRIIGSKQPRAGCRRLCSRFYFWRFYFSWLTLTS